MNVHQIALVIDWPRFSARRVQPIYNMPQTAPGNVDRIYLPFRVAVKERAMLALNLPLVFVRAKSKVFHYSTPCGVLSRDNQVSNKRH
jgi:hypothetical protein